MTVPARETLTCAHCRFEFPVDDVYLTFSSGYCICMGCHTRIVEEDDLPMDRRLVRDVSDTLQQKLEWGL